MTSDTRVTVVVGNIVEQPDCEAIVNAANAWLRAGAGVCGAIHDAAGRELEPCAMKLAPLGLGQAVITPGFDLPNRWVIHVRGPQYHVDPDPSLHLAAALENVLRLADANGVKRLAVPAISTGVYAYPMTEAAAVLMRTASATAAALVAVEEIRFVVTDERVRQVFLAAL